MRAKGIINGIGLSLLLWGLIFWLVARARGEELPDAPRPRLTMRTYPLVVETYPPDERMIVHNRPGRIGAGKAAAEPRIMDWSFVLGHGIYAGAAAFDGWETARNLGTCAFEGNPDLGRNPSAKAIAVHDAVEVGAVVAGDALLKWWGRRQGVPRWMNMLGGNLGAMVGAGRHLHGGIEWVRLCR